jgi:hypothetical protein
MKIETPVMPQPLIESSKSLDKKEFTARNQNGGNQTEESQAFFPSPLGFGGTYSLSSLRAAVDHNAKYLTVAESNIQAAQHAPMIPKAILDYFNAR